EVAAESIESDVAGAGRCPAIPHGCAARIAGVIGLAAFFAGCSIAPRDAAGWTADYLRVGEVVISRGRQVAPVEHDETCLRMREPSDLIYSSTLAIDGDVVSGIHYGFETDATLRRRPGVVTTSNC